MDIIGGILLIELMKIGSWTATVFFRASVRSGAAKATALPAVRTKVKNSAAGCSNFMIGRLLSIIQTFVCKFLFIITSFFIFGSP